MINKNEDQSQFVRHALASRQEHDAEYYHPDHIEKYWLEKHPASFTISINHEILREMVGLETWLKVFIEDPAISSMPLKYQHDGDEITVKDMCQIMLGSIETVKKILDVIQKYAEFKFDNDPKT